MLHCLRPGDLATIMPAEVIALRDFLAGHVLREGMLIFEGVMGPWVKEMMQSAFPSDSAEELAMHELEEAAATRAARQAELKSEEAALNAAIQGAASAVDKRVAVAAKKARSPAIRGELQQIYAANKAAGAAPPPLPRWVQVCREAFDAKMKPHVHANNRWDVYTIVRVMQAHLPGVFAAALSDHFHAKQLLTGIERVVEARNRRAHRLHVTEGDVVDCCSRLSLCSSSAVRARQC